MLRHTACVKVSWLQLQQVQVLVKVLSAVTALHLLQKDFKVGYIALEESIKRTSLGIMGVSLHKPLHLTREGVDDDTLRHTYNATVGNGNFYLYNHFGSTVADNLISKIDTWLRLVQLILLFLTTCIWLSVLSGR